MKTGTYTREDLDGLANQMVAGFMDAVNAAMFKHLGGVPDEHNHLLAAVKDTPAFRDASAAMAAREKDYGI